AAYFWLLVAASLAAAYAFYQALTGSAVPHSLVGAYRHALTVGFISLIIMGMASRIVPVFTGVRLHNDLWLLATFVLVNLGNTLRVVSQPLADLVGGPSFVVMGVSGFIEVTGLALFVVNLWRTIDSPVVEAVEPAPTDERAITQDMLVFDVLQAHPAALAALIELGFGELKNPIARRIMTRAVTLIEAARIKGIDPAAMLERLNEVCGAPSVPGVPTLDREAVFTALKGCLDPELGVNIVDLGLVYDVRISADAVRVDMTLTAPDCPMSHQMLAEVNEALAALPGVKDTKLNLVFQPPWTPARLSPAARQRLGMKVA
ncbi:MAG: iron-sulfur cluster assembly protein, partial [Chloroflexota bacterium]